MFYTTPRIVYHTHKHSAATFVEGKVVLTITKMFFCRWPWRMQYI
jgi:hypothetical protein